MRLYREMIDRDIETMLILEDDTKINNAILSVIDGCRHFPDGWDIVFLGCGPRRAFLKSIQGGHSFSDGFQLNSAYGVDPFTCTHACMVSRQGALKPLKLTSSIHKPIDYYTGDLKSLKLYVFRPNVVAQGLFPSLVNLGRINRKAEDKQHIKDEYWLKTFPWLKKFPAVSSALVELRLLSRYKKLKGVNQVSGGKAATDFIRLCQNKISSLRLLKRSRSSAISGMAASTNDCPVP